MGWAVSLGVLLAQNETFTISPESSDVGFTLGGSVHEVHGNFYAQSGSIQFDRTASRISSSVVVAAGSGKTGNDSRDKNMTNEVLDVVHSLSCCSSQPVCSHACA
jgi:polyisoprenoid-binding protein YceI